MEKFINILNNLYNSDSRIMLYVYIAIAIITIILVIIIIISSIRTKKDKKVEDKQFSINDNVPVINNLEEPVSISNQEPIKEEKPLILNESTPEIRPLPIPEKKIVYDKPLEIDPELDLTRPIQRISTASDLLNEFSLEESLIKSNNPLEITAEELNKPILVEEDSEKNKPNQSIYSSVFLDRKEDKPKIKLEFTPIEPLKIDKITEKPEAKELILNPKVLKPEIENKEKNTNPKEEKLPLKTEEESLKAKLEKKELVTTKKISEVEKPKEEIENKEFKTEEKEDDSLDTKVDIFNHESLLKKNLEFDPFKPKTQEELLGEQIKEEKITPQKNQNNNTLVLSADDLKNKLSKLQSNAVKKEESFDEILKQVGLDELPDLYEVDKEEIKGLSR